MTTIGVKLYHGPALDADVKTNETKAAWIARIATESADIDEVILGVQNIPELQGAPNAIDVTSLEDTESQAEPGLIPNASLNIVMNYKVGVHADTVHTTTEDGQVISATDDSNFEQCLDLSDDVHGFKIVLPNGRWFAFNAKARTTAGAMQVASALTFTLTLFKQSRVFTGYDKSLVSGVSSGLNGKTSIASVDSLVRVAPLSTPNDSEEGSVDKSAVEPESDEDLI